METVNYNVNKLSNRMIEFCKRNGITEEELEKISELELSKNEKVSNINPIIPSYGIIDISSTEIVDVCIGDIVGFRPYDDKTNLFDILSKCYTDETTPYKYGTRSNSKLEMTKEELIKDMDKSFSSDIVEVNEIEGKIFISNNGCHRTSLIKLLYTDEVLKGEKPIEEIRENYKIKAKIIKYDTTLSYIHYLLTMMNIITNMKVEYDERSIPTGKYIVEVNDNKSVLSRDEIINLFKESLKSNSDKIDLNQINKFTSIPTFKDFLKEYVLEENNYGNSRNNM